MGCILAHHALGKYVKSNTIQTVGGISIIGVYIACTSNGAFWVTVDEYELFRPSVDIRCCVGLRTLLVLRAASTHREHVF